MNVKRVLPLCLSLMLCLFLISIIALPVQGQAATSTFTPTAPPQVINPTPLASCGLPTTSAWYFLTSGSVTLTMTANCTYDRWSIPAGSAIIYVSRGTVTINGGGFTISGPPTRNFAISIEGASTTLNLNNVTISSNGHGQYPVNVTSGARLNATDVTINSSGHWSSVWITGSGSRADLNRVRIESNNQSLSTGSANGSAITAEQGGTVNVTGGIFRGNRGAGGAHIDVIAIRGASTLALAGCITFENNVRSDGTTVAREVGQYDSGSFSPTYTNNRAGECTSNSDFTPVAPTAIPATTVPPTTVPPTTVPPTTVPPTTVPATTVPPTTVPATTVPPTTVPATTVPPTTVPATTVPPTTVPATTVPPTTVPATTVPATTVPATTVPATTVPATTVPATTVPATTVPATTVPATTVPATTVPATTVPATTVPATTVPPTTVPDTVVPGTPGPSPTPGPKKKKKSTPTPTFTASPQPQTCVGFSANTGIVIYATYGLTSGVQCQQIGGGGIGLQSIIDAGFIDAVDIWGYVEQGIEVCFPQFGRLLFLDARTVPRAIRPLDSYIYRGMTCGWIASPGSIVLMPH